MNQYMFDTRLPKAPLITVAWHWWWFKYLWDDRRLDSRLRTPWWMTARNANYFQFWAGPLNVGWRRPWLYGPARQHLELFHGNSIRRDVL